MTSKQILMQLGSFMFFNTEDTEVAIPILLVKNLGTLQAERTASYSSWLKPSAFHSLVWLNKDCSYTICVNSIHNTILLPARASKQGNVIGSVRIYIYILKKL